MERKKLFDVNPGDVLAEDIISRDKVLLLEKGTVLTKTSIERLFQYSVSELKVESSEGSSFLTENGEPCSVERKYGELVQTGTRDLLIAYSGLSRGEKKEMARVCTVAAEVYREIKKNRRLMLLFGGNEDFSRYIYSHSFAVMVYSLAIASTLGFKDEELFNTGLGAALHDVGMLVVADRIWLKKKIFTHQDRKIISAHPGAGVSLVQEAGIKAKEVLSIIEEHHERMDGSGYPSRKSAGTLSTASKIVAVADTYSAMISERAHRYPFQPRHAIQTLIRETGRRYDRNCVAALINNIGLYPVNTSVVLSDYRVGRICETTSNPWRPVVELVTDGKYEKIDLSLPENLYLYIKTFPGNESPVF